MNSSQSTLGALYRQVTGDPAQPGHKVRTQYRIVSGRTPTRGASCPRNSGPVLLDRH
jgi:hypothetical protein